MFDYFFQISSIVGNKVNVLFYGDHTTANLSRKKVIPFKAHEPPLPVKRPLLQEAIFEAFDEVFLKTDVLAGSGKLHSNEVTNPETDGIIPGEGGIIYRNATYISSSNGKNATEADELRALRIEMEEMEAKMPKSVDVMYVKLYY